MIRLAPARRNTRTIGQRLERHYGDMCDIEFTVASGELFILQTRVGRRSPEATVRIAVQMAQEADFPLSKEEAVGRIDQATLDGIAALAAVKDADATVLVLGLTHAQARGEGAREG